MINFLTDNPRTLEKNTRWIAVILTVVSMVFCVFLSPGCKKSDHAAQAPAVLENVYTNRANDVAYLKALDQNRYQQIKEAESIRSAVAAMTAYRNQVKSTFPAVSNEVALTALLEKDPTWLKLKADCDVARETETQTRLAAREMVRQAMLKESQARAAVADGKARALDGKK